MSKQQRLYRREFSPVTDIGEIVMLRNSQGGFLADAGYPAFWSVTHVEAIPMLGLKGTTVIWCHTAAPAAGYVADANAVAGSQLAVDIPQNGLMAALSPAFCNLLDHQFLQFRHLVRAVPDSAAGALTGAIEDYDLLWSSPAATARFGTSKVAGVVNAVGQFTEPADTQAAPARGSNQGGTTNTQMDPYESPTAVRSQMFVYGPSTGNGNATVSIRNNGAGATAAGAIGLNVAGFLFNVTPVPMGRHAQKKFFAGRIIDVPAEVNLDEVTVIPTGVQLQPGENPPVTGP